MTTKQYFFFQDKEEIEKKNQACTEMENLLGGAWKYADWMERAKSVRNVFMEHCFGSQKTVPPAITIEKFSPKVVSNFVPGYTNTGFPSGTIKINSRYLDTNPEPYQALVYLMRELTRWKFWKKALDNKKTRFVRTGKKLQNALLELGLTVDSKGEIEKAGTLSQGKFLYRNMLQKCKIECPETFEAKEKAEPCNKPRTSKNEMQKRLVQMEILIETLAKENALLKQSQPDDIRATAIAKSYTKLMLQPTLGQKGGIIASDKSLACLSV